MTTRFTRVFAKYDYDVWTERIFAVSCPLLAIGGGIYSAHDEKTFGRTMVSAIVGTSIGVGTSIILAFFHPVVVVGGCIGLPVYAFNLVSDSPSKHEPMDITVVRVIPESDTEWGYQVMHTPKPRKLQ